MKYERQQHSRLFIALQERKKKDGESSHTIYTPGQSWYYCYYFFFPLAKREFCNALAITVAAEKVAHFGNARASYADRSRKWLFLAISAIKAAWRSHLHPSTVFL